MTIGLARLFRGRDSTKASALLPCSQPRQQLERALGVRAGGFRNEEQVQSLTRNAEHAREIRFFAMSHQPLFAGAGEFVPERRFRPRAQGAVAALPFGRAIGFGGNARRFDRASDQSVGQWVQLPDLRWSFHAAIMAAENRMSSIK